jgi:hypothetical protein
MFRKKKKPSTETPRRVRPPATGSQRSSIVFSYHAARSPGPENTGRGDTQTTSRPRPRRGFKITFRRLLGILLLIGLLGLAANALIVSAEPKIVAVGDREAQAFLQEDAVYGRAAASFMAESLLNRNKITFDAGGISQQLREQFPELAHVSVTLPLLGNQPVVHIQAFTPELILTNGGSGTFVLNQEGRAFLPGSKVPALERFELPVVRDESGLPLKNEEIVLPAPQVDFITEVSRQLAARQVKVNSMVLPANSSELAVHIKDKPYTVRFNLYGDAREEAGRYLAAKDYLEARREEPQGYIDVRVDNRVYYR